VSGALKANALPVGARRLAVRAVKGAHLRLSERSERPLTGQAGGPGASFQQEGQAKKKLLRTEFTDGVYGLGGLVA
jgi:hypothetical protein